MKIRDILMREIKRNVGLIGVCFMLLLVFKRFPAVIFYAGFFMIYLLVDLVLQVRRYKRTPPDAKEKNIRFAEVNTIGENGLTLEGNQFVPWREVAEIIKVRSGQANIWSTEIFTVMGHEVDTYELKLLAGGFLRLKNLNVYSTYSIPRSLNEKDEICLQKKAALLAFAMQHSHIAFSRHDEINGRIEPLDPSREIKRIDEANSKEAALKREKIRTIRERKRVLHVLLWAAIALTFVVITAVFRPDIFRP